MNLYKTLDVFFITLNTLGAATFGANGQWGWVALVVIANFMIAILPKPVAKDGPKE